MLFGNPARPSLNLLLPPLVPCPPTTACLPPHTLSDQDEINTGLDSATLHSVVQFLALMTRGLGLTTLVSLLQPSPEAVALFDDVIVMADGGAIVYHGPVDDAAAHFAALGFECPARKDVAAFLQEVTTAAGQAAYATAVSARGGAREDP